MKFLKNTAPLRKQPTLSADGLKIFLLAIILSLTGLIMVLGASGPVGERLGPDSLYYFKRHLASFIGGGVLLFIGYLIDYRFWQKISFYLLGLMIVLLTVVHIPGLGTTHGTSSARWVQLGLITFQASEVVKILMLIVLASILSNKGEKITDWQQGLLPVLGIIFLAVILVLFQPDMGTTIVLLASSLTLLFLAGVRFRHLLLLILLVVPAFGFFIWHRPYQRQRLLIFLNPWKDVRGKGYQIIQSLLSLGSGGLLGVGLGGSRQKFSYLPQQFTDFIFAIIGEEAGLWGTVGVLTIYFLLVFWGLRLAFNCPDVFGRYLAAGIVCLIGWQALVNIGVATGALPVTGIPLPFISYGGTSLVMNLGSVGILLNIARSR